MFPSTLTNTYHRYKQDTDNIATWLATTAQRFGFCGDLVSADLITRNSHNQVQKSKRLKGKARAKAKQDAKVNAASMPNSPSRSMQKYAVSVKDFVTLADYLASKPGVTVPAQATEAGSDSDERQSYFLSILKKVRHALEPRLQTGSVKSQDKPTTVLDSDKEIEGRLKNLFAVLTVEEPSKEFLNVPDVAPAVEEAESAGALYEVEPFDDPLELYLATAALLQDLSEIRSTLRQIWHSYSQNCTSLISAAATTNVAIQLTLELEKQFLTDHPSESDTIQARTTFLGTQCLLQEQAPSADSPPLDPFDLTLYETAETSLIVSHIVLDSFGHVFDHYPLPMYKPGYFGVYDPKQDRGKMSHSEKYEEDKILLLEILLDITFFDHANKKTGLPATDALTKSVSVFRERRRHTLTLDFAAQIYLDIQHTLRGKSHMAWAELQRYAHNAKASLEENFRFHENLRVDAWPRVNDVCMKTIIRKVERWFEEDMLQKLTTDAMIKAGVHPETHKRHAFFTKHPWLCGSLLFGMKLDMQEVGTSFLNAWGSAKTAAQIYNAARGENFLGKEWRDMEVALTLYKDSTMFVGSRPKTTEDYCERFYLSMGYSADGDTRSKQDPPHIEGRIISPVAYELRLGYSTFDLGKANPNIDQVLAKCALDEDDLDVANIAETTKVPRRHKGSGKSKVQTTSEVLNLICQSLKSEELALTFDHFHLHRSAWRVLRAIKEASSDELRRIYGPRYIKKESRLPLVAGYILLTATQTKKLGTPLHPKKKDVVSSELLKQAAGTIEEMIETGRGGSEVKILLKHYGMRREFE
ncbi:hypothetical protein BU24DRAFT_472274 [Aaosphaeria arxii CBS 175.79]|uniref:DUF6604 domain-containing protein n=1 Tax=Aaosphaeria arxii CBS 175.79 TaxID=1450172 RepID=A0A6A5XDM5_9PLEO|nr:uncharacterized protein BU24DRAFT_472274 [Aaosphaeria arxii CBS 175.79]KAF2011118.1 hypothetical protein BU24DRAFT_472274 [Aaosphaeria arxii CBS 175.79]